MAETQYVLVAPQEVQQPTASRLAWVDLIRAGGAFLVVLAHVVLYPGLKGSGPLWAETAYYTASRVAVPLFFMVSGFLLLGRTELLRDFFRKRALRVFVPFLIWSFIYLAWNGGFDKTGLTPAGILEGLARILRGPRAAHLWFFYVLIGLYLITPVLRLFTMHAREADLAYFCAMWFLLDPVLSLVKRLTGLQVGFEFGFFTGYIGYFVLGFLAGRLRLTRRGAWLAALIFTASFVLVFATIYIGQQQPGYDQFYEGYLSAPVVLLTGSAFYLSRLLEQRVPPRLMRWVLPLSAASLGIYLLHVIMLDLFGRFAGPALPFLATGTTIVVMPLVALAAYLVCFAVVFALQHLPILKYSVP